MGRRVVRVPLDFNAPIGEVWHGYLMPARLTENPCPDCENGYSTQAQHLHNLWYGYLPFDPTTTGSSPFTPDTTAVRALAERNVTRAPDYYDTGEHAIRREARRLAALFNGQWCHHLDQDDVKALLAEGRLYDLTHAWTQDDGWQPINPPVAPTAAQVNEWSLAGFGHDAINAGIVIKARCAREGVPYTCATCGGHGSLEAYEGQRTEAEAWKPTEPPAGDGWQLWETVSEGSPVSPVFATADELASWMSDPARGRDWVPGDVAAKFIADGWAPTLVASGGDVASGVEFVGMRGGDA